ncbi:hypothetical protein ACFV6E_37685 [Streptomyces sp. NPDC059785]|uniref:hypothetical protein n=1 Tax=Streptomyces sp. NPDC059785 TaxID=3346945 RepID=UPI003646DC09
MPEALSTRFAHDDAAGADTAAGRSSEATDMLLRQLVLATGPLHVLVYGPAGMSRLMPVAVALRDSGGRVVACEPDARRAPAIAAAIEEAGLSRYAEVSRKGIRQVLRELPWPIDLLVLGCPGEELLPVLRAAEPRLPPASVILICGDHGFGEQLAEASPLVDSYVWSLPLRDGSVLAVRKF